ncbi:thioesterase family protein [Nocardioides lentus]|uniref:Thioesterase family protein n=1 Tax=Nocardioides lentus TaxID=338077 RepID=A0ABN2PM28_9ACTN
MCPPSDPASDPAPARAPRPTRADYAHWRTVTTRWRDDDSYRHFNNATYYELVDTAVNAFLIEATGSDPRDWPEFGIVAETGCRYFREIGFPAPVDVGLVFERLGRSSVTYRIGMFQGGSGAEDDEAAAEARFVQVYVERERQGVGRAVVGVPDRVRTAVEPLLRS